MATKTATDNGVNGSKIDWDNDAEEFSSAVTLAAGQSIEGRYLGYETAFLPNGPCQRHHFMTADGTRVSILGAALLNGQLAGARIGRMTLVTRTDDKKGRATVYIVKQKKVGSDIPESECVGRNDEMRA